METNEKTLKKGSSRFFENAVKHPYIVLISLCIALTPLTFASADRITYSLVLAGAAVMFCVGVYTIFTRVTSRLKLTLSVIVWGIVTLFLCVGFSKISVSHRTVYIAAVGFFALLLFAAYLYINGRLNTRNIILLMIAAGFLLRVLYVLYTDLTERQHDIGAFDYEHGHASYINYLIKNKSLPDFDVRSRWQYYHPPLFHSVSALWLTLLQAFGIGDSETWECVQIVTLFCSSAVMIISYRIFRELKLQKTGLCISMALVCFAPTFIYFAGTVNNDIMSVMFMLAAIMYALRWYKERSFKNIIPLALCIGLGMMTKLSVWMVAPAVALMFLVVFIKNIKKWKNLILQYLVFGVICVPLGIWWEIRNYLLFKVPLTYIPSAGGADSTQYVGDGVHTVMQRLFDFNFSQLSSVYDKFVMYGGSYNEYNPTIGLFKTGLFGERINDVDFPHIKLAGPILFWSGVALAAVALVCVIVFLFKGNGKGENQPKRPENGETAVAQGAGVDLLIKIFFALFVVINLVSYYSFCIKYPLTCTQHARYCMSLIPVGAAYLGMCFKKGKKLSALGIVILVLTVLYCGSSAFIYSIIT